MKKHGVILIFLIFTLVGSGIFGQNLDSPGDFFEGEIDSLFEDAPEDKVDEKIPETQDTPDSGSSVFSSVLKKIGFTLDAQFDFAGGYSPGWKTAPWYWDEPNDGFTNVLLAKMESQVSLDFQLSDILRVRQSLSLAIPDLEVKIPEFFFDFNLLNVMFIRAGKYTINWGISPNFQYTNLPSRLPSGTDYPGDLFIGRVDIPIGIGGIQLVTMTRSGFLTGDDGAIDEITIDDFAFGLKYNVAVPIVDIDTGFLYNERMNTRAFISLKTTLFDQLELYSEALVSYNFHDFNNLAGSASIGFLQEFFNQQLTINAELYYNGEKNASYAQSDTFFKQDDVVPFIYGFNTALNIRYKPFWLKKTELFVSYLHGFSENTAQLVPGFRVTPFSNMNIYVAVPMALGSKDGTYYTSNVDEENRPFSIIFLVSFSGSLRYSNYK